MGRVPVVDAPALVISVPGDLVLDVADLDREPGPLRVQFEPVVLIFLAQLGVEPDLARRRGGEFARGLRRRPVEGGGWVPPSAQPHRLVRLRGYAGTHRKRPLGPRMLYLGISVAWRG